MPVNYSPDLRLRELEKLLLNTMHYPENCKKDSYRGVWTKQELAERISELFDLPRVLTTKTIENDLKKMEEDYNAPIDKKDIYLPSYKGSSQGKNVKKVGYFYYDTEKTIFSNNNLTQEDLKNLRSVVEMLKQFKGFRYFEDIGVLIDKLELKASKNKNSSIIFETVDSFSGLEYIEYIAKAIKEKQVLKIKYQPFYEKDYKTYTIHPYQLREFNNRWFVLAHTEEFEERKLGVYGLSRIIEIPTFLASNYINEHQKLIENYFEHIIGVTNYLNSPVEHIIFEVFGTRARYVSTKPWHSSQKLIKENENSSLFSIDVKINNELLALILQFGEDLKVVEPLELVEIVQKKLLNSIKMYNEQP